MKKNRLLVLFAVGLLATMSLFLAGHRPASWGQPEQGEAKANGEQEDDEAAIRQTSEAFIKAFDKGDAKALAAMWTSNGEYTNDAGEVLKGRKEIEKNLTEFFKKNKGIKLQIQIGSIRFLASSAAVEEGTSTITKDEKKQPLATRYSVLHVKEGGAWRMALVREWEAVAIQSKLQDLNWLVGDWTAKNDDKQINFTYHWDKNKTFLKCDFTIKEGEKVVASGHQIIGRDPVEDVVRSWLFSSDGSYGHGVWLEDGNRWTIETASKQADGSQAWATNLITKTSDDAFTFQSVNRSADGADLPDTAPVKVARVKKTN